MIKLKSIILILISCIVISAVLILTILGTSLFLNWKEKDVARLHTIKISKLNAEFYSRHIKISDLQAKKGKDSIYKEKYLIEGSIKNTGFRTISSAILEIHFLNSDRRVIHTESFKPLASFLPPSKSNIATLSIFASGKELPLAPGQSLKFKRILSTQKKKDVISPIKYKRYATNPNEWSGKFDYKITKMGF